METVSCPHCGGSRSTTVFSAADQDGIDPFEYPIVRCSDCGLQYVNPRPTLQEIGKFYQDEFYGQQAWSLLSAIFSKVRRRLVATSVPRGRVLDIGCGNGAFLAEMKAAGWDVFGIETSPSGQALASARLGGNVSRADLKATGYPDAHFDLITLWGVLEHVHDPQALLAEIRRVLKPSGLVVFTTQNMASVQVALTKSRWFHLDVPRHLLHFTPDTLTAMLKKTGFGRAWCGTYFAEYSLPGMLQSLLNLIFGDMNFFYKLVKGKVPRGRPIALKVAAHAVLLAPVTLCAVVLEGAACLAGRGGGIVLFARKA